MNRIELVLLLDVFDATSSSATEQFAVM